MRRAIPLLLSLAILAACGPTATQAPPTPAGGFDRWRAMDVQRAFADAGLAANGWRDRPAGDAGDQPRVWVEHRRFAASGGAGYVQTYATQAALMQALDWYGKRQVADPDRRYHVFTKDNVLVEIDPRLTVAEANRYRDALAKLK